MTATTTYVEAQSEKQTLTLAEREQGHLYLKQTESGVIGAIKGMSAEQWNFSAGREAWSIAQNVEHIIFVLERVAGPVFQELEHAPVAPMVGYQRIDEIVVYRFPNRLKKYVAPPFANPQSRYATPAEGAEAVSAAYRALAERLDCSPHLRGCVLEAAPLKALTEGEDNVMDGYQWILAAAAHAERHTKQILEVRAHEGFPVWRTAL